jgi:hypothetical protein
LPTASQKRSKNVTPEFIEQGKEPYLRNVRIRNYGQHFDDEIDRDSDDEHEQAENIDQYAYDVDVMAVMDAKNSPEFKNKMSGTVPAIVIPSGNISRTLVNTAANAAIVLDKFKRFITADDIYQRQRQHQHDLFSDDNVHSFSVSEQTNFGSSGVSNASPNFDAEYVNIQLKEK